jgi:WD40 repeat protein
MKLLAGIRKWIVPTRRVALCALWLGGLALIYWLTPYEPKANWPPQDYEMVLGFLNDDRTVVRLPISRERVSTPTVDPRKFDQPAVLFNAETGRSTRVALGEKVGWVVVDPSRRWLVVSESRSNSRFLLRGNVLRVIDPINGKQQSRIAGEDDPASTWYLSPDGRTVVRHVGSARLACYDTISGALLWTADQYVWPDSERFKTSQPIDWAPCFSGDGKLLAAARPGSVDVLDVRSGQRIARLASVRPAVPLDFSPDGRLLVDEWKVVWDVALAKQRFRLGSQATAARFSADGKTVMASVSLFSECQLRYYDAATGDEAPERRLTLVTGSQASLSFYSLTTANRRLLWASGATVHDPSVIERWLARIPGLGHLGAGRVNHVDRLVDSETGRTLFSGSDPLLAVSNDGRYLVTYAYAKMGGMGRLWELPLKTPWATVLRWGGAWSVVLGAIAWLVWRRRRRREDGAVGRRVTGGQEDKQAQVVV